MQIQSCSPGNVSGIPLLLYSGLYKVFLRPYLASLAAVTVYAVMHGIQLCTRPFLLLHLHRVTPSFQTTLDQIVRL